MIDITWLGHSAFQLRLETGETLLLDPWITGNPKHPQGHIIDRCDAILLTHGHGDHSSDVAALSKKHKAPVVAIHEISEWLNAQGVETRGMGKGGTIQIAGVSVTMTHAVHSSSIDYGDKPLQYAGEAAGFVITLADGRAIYYAGDTNVFSDMALIAELYQPSLCILPIGDLYTMGPREAAVACRLLQAKQVIGMHWGTFPPLHGTPEKLADLVPAGCEVLKMAPGETIRW